MADSAVKRMKNFQIFLFCSADIASLILNGGILLLLLLNKKARDFPSNLFFVSIIAFQLVTALCAINLAVLFEENKAEELRKDTVIVQVTFTLIGLGLHHFMLAIDRILFIKMQEKYCLVMGKKQTWLMLILSWLIPAITAISSSVFSSDGEPTSQVSYALAILTIASGVTLAMALIAINVYIFKEMSAVKRQWFEKTRRLRKAILHTEEHFFPCRVSMVMAVSYIFLLFPQILFAFGKLLKTRGLLDMWYMQLSGTIMLCSGIVDASLYIYMNKNLRQAFRSKMQSIRGKKGFVVKEESIAEEKNYELKDVEKDMDTLLLKHDEKKDSEITFL